KCMGTFCN
ncbi:hypothetical protein ECEC1866_1519, partial [Escherichia coli EC1866]